MGFWLKAALAIIGTIVALTVLLYGITDFSLRSREDFEAARSNKRAWLWIQIGAFVLGFVPYAALGRANATLVFVPVVWLAAELAYLVAVRPRLERVRPVGARRTWKTSLSYAALTTVAAIFVFPVYITVVNSLLQPDQITSRPPKFFPFDPEWSTYRKAFVDGHMGRYMLNSTIMTVIIVAFEVGTAVLAGYAFAALEFPGKRIIFVVFLATLMLPFEVTITTNLMTISDAGLYNTYAGLTLPFLATGFGAFLMRQTFLGLPRDLHDAAELDGLGHLKFLWKVAVPLARPTIAALTVFSFLGSWNQYLWPLLVTRDDNLRTVQIGVKQLRATQIDQFNVTYAGLVIAMIPLVIVLIVFQKQLIRGLTAGAVKG